MNKYWIIIFVVAIVSVFAAWYIFRPGKVIVTPPVVSTPAKPVEVPQIYPCDPLTEKCG